MQAIKTIRKPRRLYGVIAPSYTLTSRELVRQVPSQKRLFSPLYSLGDFVPLITPLQKEGYIMNRNPKEKPARIEIRTEPGKKKKITQLAEKCNLSVSEYMVQRALGYEPRSVLPDAFYRFYSKLCDVTNELKETVTPETEARLVELVEYIHSTLLLPYKKTAEEIQKETKEMEDWLRRDFGL